MQTITLNSLGKTILFSSILTTMIHAEAQNDIEKKHNLDTTVIQTTYESMTTEEIQKEVEKHSETGCLSFALGKELIKRWTKS